jgi:hypothetical protein
MLRERPAWHPVDPRWLIGPGETASAALAFRSTMHVTHPPGILRADDLTPTEPVGAEGDTVHPSLRFLWISDKDEVRGRGGRGLTR